MRLDSHVCYSAAHPPEHLEAILKRNRFDGAILVVDGRTVPATGPHIAGVVVPLSDWQRDPRVHGVHAPIADVIPELAEEIALPLDLEIRPADFPALRDLAARLPNLRIAIDHLARPHYIDGPTDDWLRGMESAARLPNVFCKISRPPTDVAPVRPFVHHALAVFGPSRLMFGSEWPVRLPDVTWKQSLAAFTQSIGAQSMEVREQLLGGTAAAFYGIPGI